MKKQVKIVKYKEHLYFIISDYIRNGDFFINKGIYQYSNIENVEFGEKIVSSTNDELLLPKISNEFVTEFYEKNGKINCNILLEPETNQYDSYHGQVSNKLIVKTINNECIIETF